jgi:hypothetical protein
MGERFENLARDIEETADIIRWSAKRFMGESPDTIRRVESFRAGIEFAIEEYSQTLAWHTEPYAEAPEHVTFCDDGCECLAYEDGAYDHDCEDHHCDTDNCDNHVCL